ncbi:hypothetical protein ACFV2X_32650 [Streptomyces sp. NPDC059679]|uniref:hypothetical protein n=1 Tax=Streptomyces sp. NPDC059679 TaxID=3346903 RepID=UPI0036B03256
MPGEKGLVGSALLLASQVAYDVIRITGAAVLVWMGARALWQARRVGRRGGRGGPDTEPAETAEVSCRRAYWQGRRRRMEQISGAVLVGLGLRLAVES